LRWIPNSGDRPKRLERKRALNMSQHVAISPTEAAARLAIRELIEAYAAR